MTYLKPKQLILLGASTGGPGFIEKIVTSLGDHIDICIIIAVHMNTLLLESFAKRLNRINNISVDLITQELKIEKGKIYLLEDTSTVYEKNNALFLKKQEPSTSFYHPAIDELFLSATKLNNLEISAYLLTGIGADGAKGMLELKNKGFYTVAQDEESSIVYGMPKRAFEMGAAQSVKSIEQIVEDIKKKS